MTNEYPMRFGNLSSASSVAPPRSYLGTNVSRRDKFAARSARRWGDWGILEVPTAMLWAEEACMLTAEEDDLACPEPGMGLWP
jgi:hypothetical protein